MLNVSQLPNNNKYTPSFRGKIDYSQIYKEMEKISLRQEEKIVPKSDLKNRTLPKISFPLINQKAKTILYKFLYGCLIVGGTITYGTFVYGMIKLTGKWINFVLTTPSNKSNHNEQVFSHNENNGTKKTALKDRTISFEECCKNETIKLETAQKSLKSELECKVDSLNNLLKKDSISTEKFATEVEKSIRKIRKSKL